MWETIEYERVHGYEHRAPKSRKQQKKNQIETTGLEKTLCLIKINSDTGDAMLDKKDSNYVSESLSNDATKTVQLPNSTNKSNTLQFFKIRTQSFDESKHNTNTNITK